MLRQDIRYALRLLARSPGFAAAAMLTLAVGIGANATLYSVVRGVLLNALAYPHSDRLMAVYASTPGMERAPATYMNFLDWQRQSRSFQSLAIYRNEDFNLTGTAPAERVSGHMISAEFFRTLGVRPSLGRDFGYSDDQIGAGRVAILGGGFWQRRFGGARNIIGQTVTLNGVPYTVVGVVPAGFRFYGQQRDVYVPIGQWDDPSFRDRRISVSARVIGRLVPAVTQAQAQAEMDVIARRLAAEFPVADKGTGIRVVSLKEDMVGGVQPLLMLLLAAVGFLLLTACANVANLLLARSLKRARELALRAALGAGRPRVIRQLLTESLVLAAAGGGLGLLLAWLGLRAAATTLSGTLPRAEEIALDVPVLLFTVALSAGAAILCGLAPALKGSRVSLAGVLQQGGRGLAGGRHPTQAVFVALEMAVVLVLLTGAGLMVRTLHALWRVDPGYNPSHAITFNLSIPATPDTTSADTRARLRLLDEQLSAIPGVQAVSVTLGSRPMIHDSSLPFWIEGHPRPANENEMPQALFYLVEGGFERAMGLTLERGRFVNARDNERTRIVIDIDDVFARTYFPGEDPVGRRIHLKQFEVAAEIVGVVAHIRQWGPGGDNRSAIEAQFFYPFMQLPEKLMPMVAGGVAVVLRTAGDPALVMPLVRRAVAQHDAREVIYAVRTLEGVLADTLAPRAVTMRLLSLFAGLALLLAAVGVYAVISFVVGQRTQEIGVRMALGAQAGDVMRMVMNQGMRMILAGVAGGVAMAMALSRFIAGQLYGVAPADPLSFVLAAGLLMAAGLAACYVPARRAVRVDPIAALRPE